MIYPIPTGTRDVLPEEMGELLALIDALRRVFGRFKYREVSTPTIEYEDALVHADERSAGASYRLVDESGRVLVLRPDMTIPIARLVATRYAHVEPPLRLATFGRTFRAVRPLRGQLRESLQAGIELMGLPGPEGDAEVVAVLCTALDEVGLREFKVGLGDARLYRSLLRDLSIPDEQVLYELVTRDFVGLEREVKALELDAKTTELLIRLPRLRGGPEVLDRVKEADGGAQFAAACAALEACHGHLQARGIADRVIFDLGLVRDLGYYTGVIFEVYDPALGLTLGGGGRYDDLLGRFGRPLPAVGFDLCVERLHIAVTELQE